MSHAPSSSSFLGTAGGDFLSTGHVHVWRAIVDVPSARLQVYEDVLSPDERARAQRLHRPHHRRGFTAARGILRHILAHYLGTSPRDIRFESGPFGKPFLPDPVRPPLYFNVTHSRELAVYAVSRDFEVGIDLEADRESTDYAKLAERICSPEEFLVFQQCPQVEQKAAFFRYWTRKEAFVKAIGTGLSFPLKQVTVSIASDQSPQLLTIEGHVPHELFDLSLEQGFWGALAVAGRPCHVQGLDYVLEDGRVTGKALSRPCSRIR